MSLLGTASLGLMALGVTAAQAATATIGDLNLTPAMGNLTEQSPERAPVFQSQAGANYVLSSPGTGTVVDFSFLSAGAPPGAKFALAVLRQGLSGSAWTLGAVSPPVEVISPMFTDSVNGPYPADLPIEIGDRIALEPVGSSDVPIEPGDTSDSVGFFASSVPGPGISATSTTAADEVLPLQATVSFTPISALPELVMVSNPPVDETPPVVKGKPQAGQTLTCEPGKWTNNPTFGVTWSQTTGQLVAGKPPKVTSTTVEVASGPTYLVPDLPEGVSVFCTVTASNAGTLPGAGPKASSAAVGLETIPPALAPSFSFVLHTKRNMPTISEGVGATETNVCRPGIWQHYPSEFKYLWFEKVYSQRLRRFVPKLVWEKPKYLIPIKLELHEIYCQVTASNSAGSTRALSNTVVVPRLAAKALGGVRMEVVEPAPVTQNPVTSREKPLFWRQQGSTRYAFLLACHAPKFNRHVTTTITWETQFYAESKTGYGLPVSGPFAPEDSFSGPTLEITPNPNPAHLLPAGNEPLFNGVAPPITGALSTWNAAFALDCSVNAHIPGTKLHTIVYSSVFYLLATGPFGPGYYSVASEKHTGGK
jgi:hypothetical protein